MRTLVVLAFGAALTGCGWDSTISGNGDGPKGPQPDIVIEPPALDFPRLSEGETATATFTVTNRGKATLDVSALEVVTGAAAFSVAGPDVFELEIDESLELEVTFTPTNQDDNYGRIEVVSDDPDTPRAPVDLHGLGSVPDLEITPRNWTFGEAFVPCGDDVNVKLENVGSEDIVVDDIHYNSADGDLALRDIDDVLADLPIVLSPGESYFLAVDWTPSENAQDVGTLVVGSNDPVGDETAKQTGTGVYVGQITETFNTPGVPPVDLMFLIDQSCSMALDNEDTLANGIPAFFGKLRELSDWQLVQVNGGNACANGGIYNGATPSAESRFTSTAFSPNAYIAESLSESLLELAQMALDETGPGGCNAGFVRPGALLHVVVASDEREQSDISWRTHLSNFEQFVSDPDLLRVSAIVDLATPPACGNGTADDGSGGYREAADATGGAKVDICSSTWGDQLPSLAEDVLEGVRSYNLANRAVEASIEVAVNGQATTQFSYSDDARTVTVLDPPIGGGDTVTITYAIAGSCN